MNDIVQEALSKGVEMHKAGELDLAKQLYTSILQLQPQHPDANHNLGVIAIDTGNIEEAVPFLQTALEADPNQGQYWISYIEALIKLDALDDAQSMLNQAKEKGASGDAFDQLEQTLNDLTATVADNGPDNSPDEKPTTIAKDVNPPQDQLQALIGLYSQGQLQQTLVVAKQLLQQFPNSAILYNIKGAANAALKQFDEAIDCYKKALEIKPDYAEAYSNIGLALIENGDLEPALESYRQALKMNPDYAEAHYNMGNALREKDDTEAAIESFKQAIKIKPDYADAEYNLAVALNEKGDLEAAIESYKKTIAIKPDYVEAYSNMGAALQEKGDSELAIESYKQLLKIKPDYATAYLNMGAILNEKGDHDAAIDSYKQALNIVPNYAEVHYNMGISHNEKGNHDAAIDSYKQALNIKPYYAEVHYNMGISLNEKGDHDGAITSYKQAIKIKPDYAAAFNNMGIALQDKGELVAAIETFNQAIEIKPDYAKAYCNIGDALQINGDLETAIENYKQAMKTKPDYAEAYCNMGIALRGQGKLEEAIEAFNQALSIKPNYAEAYTGMGNTLQDQGKPEEAIEALNKVLSITGDHADTSYNTGILLYRIGALKKAARHFRKDKSIKSQSYLLKCLYEQDDQSSFYTQLDYLINRGDNNAVIGSHISRSKVRYGLNHANPFCDEPLEYVSKIDLTERCDFKKIFVTGATDILSDGKVQNRSQSLLTNGIQTAGNVFNQIGTVTDRIQNIIRAEIENYRLHFKDSREGLIRSWPSEYNIDGWIVSMKNGGELGAHMHDQGWISGSVYINVPPKVNKDSGNLVVCLGDETDGDENKKSIDVVTGNLCLFPSSLFHYTIPFEADEDRIVLAFDVVPK